MLLSKWEIIQLRRRYSAIPAALEWIDAQIPSPEAIPPRRRRASLPCRRAPRRRISLEAAAIELARQARDEAPVRTNAPKPAAKPAPVRTNAPKPAAKPAPVRTNAAKPAAKRRTRKSSKPRRRKAAATRPLTPGELALAELRSRRRKHAATLS